MKLFALVPMRHHSQRVPGKNYRLLAGKPLFHHIIETLLAVREINQIVVDTDSDPVMEGLHKNFPQVKVINRPYALRADDIPMNDILLYDTSQVEADFYLQTHTTNPLLQRETVSRSIQTFLFDYPNHDSLFSVTRLQTRLYDQDGKAINHDPSVLIQTQDLPPFMRRIPASTFSRARTCSNGIIASAQSPSCSKWPLAKPGTLTKNWI